MHELEPFAPPLSRRLLRARPAAHRTLRHPDTILVIEDDTEMRRLLGHTLERAGYRIVSARSGGAAIDWLGLSVFDGSLENTPALIVSDLRLPDFSGLDLLDALGETRERVPTILITGFPSEETAREARELGAAVLLEKPFEMETLRYAVQSVLGERAARVATLAAQRRART